MFAGKEETVTLRCDRTLTGVMIDRFGKDVAMRKMDENTVSARVNVAVSRQFFGWVTGLGNALKIEAPERVVVPVPGISWGNSGMLFEITDRNNEGSKCSMKQKTYQIVLDGIVITVTKKPHQKHVSAHQKTRTAWF